MTKRPSSTYNDPGFLYNQRRLMKMFFFATLALVAGILAMIWADFDRPWKHQQRDHREWEASRMALEDWILRVQTQKLRRQLARERRKAAEIVAQRKKELSEVLDLAQLVRGAVDHGLPRQEPDLPGLRHVRQVPGQDPSMIAGRY